MKQLLHQGVFIPPYDPKGLSIGYRGERIQLTPDQEEMALAFARQPEERMLDRTFVENFLKDFCTALKLNASSIEEFDFSEVKRWVEDEKRKKEAMTREERKALAEERKRVKNSLREKYGFAIIDGERVEINYGVEPPCIFVGRGKHPLRGRWKPRVRYTDITLNLSPDAPTPETPTGEGWAGRVWDPDALWVARWRDGLTGKMKYVWISETAPSKQRREIEKFDLARRLGKHMREVSAIIEQGLYSEDPLERQIATAVYLINELKLRVGDEKDPDELDTVGVTTLEKKNIKVMGNRVSFDFLGKGAVRFRKTVELPPKVVENLRSFISNSSRGRIFNIRSEQVNEFLARVMPGLTSKVFRTYHACECVDKTLRKFKVYPGSPEFKKIYVARRANLEAARLLNHRRKPPKNYQQRVDKQIQREAALKAKLEEVLKKPLTRARERQIRKLRMKIWEAKLKLELIRKTKYYNLGTSLRSYIDPRVYAKWAKQVSFQWEKIYPKALQRKFSWVKSSK